MPLTSSTWILIISLIALPTMGTEWRVAELLLKLAVAESKHGSSTTTPDDTTTYKFTTTHYNVMPTCVGVAATITKDLVMPSPANNGQYDPGYTYKYLTKEYPQSDWCTTSRDKSSCANNYTKNQQAYTSCMSDWINLNHNCKTNWTLEQVCWHSIRD